MYSTFTDQFVELMSNNRLGLKELRKRLRNPPIESKPVIVQTDDLEVQTDLHYYSMCLMNQNVVLNEKHIKFLEREQRIIVKKFKEHREDFQMPSHMNFTLFIEYPSINFLSPYLRMGKNKYVLYN